jgi:hypothetical protein
MNQNVELLIYNFLNRRMNTNPETPAKIDWTYYKKNVPMPGLVDKFQKEYESFKVPYPADKYTSEVEAEEKQVVQYLLYIKYYVLHLRSFLYHRYITAC